MLTRSPGRRILPRLLRLIYLSFVQFPSVETVQFTAHNWIHTGHHQIYILGDMHSRQSPKLSQGGNTDTSLLSRVTTHFNHTTETRTHLPLMLQIKASLPGNRRGCQVHAGVATADRASSSFRSVSDVISPRPAARIEGQLHVHRLPLR